MSQKKRREPDPRDPEREAPAGDADENQVPIEVVDSAADDAEFHLDLP